MNDPQPIDLRRRIRELNAIPDRDRTDEQWDELNELEIRMAPGNRESDRPQDRPLDRRPGAPVPGRHPRNKGAKNNNGNNNNGQRPEARQQQEGRNENRPPKQRQHRRPKRPTEPPSGG